MVTVKPLTAASPYVIGSTMTPLTGLGAWTWSSFNTNTKTSILTGDSTIDALRVILQGKSTAPESDLYAIKDPESFGGITPDNTALGGPVVIPGNYPDTTTSPDQSKPVVTHIYALGGPVGIYKVARVVDENTIEIHDPANSASGVFAVGNPIEAICQYLPQWTRAEFTIATGATLTVIGADGSAVSFGEGRVCVEDKNGLGAILCSSDVTSSVILST